MKDYSTPAEGILKREADGTIASQEVTEVELVDLATVATSGNYNDLNNKKITKKEFKELVYGDPELSTITVPFNEISNIRKEKNKYFMHIDSLHYEVEITNYKVLKYLQENCK